MDASWYCLTVKGEEVAAGKVEEYREAFEKAFAAAKGPRLMALFKRSSEDGGMTLFFTPMCEDQARDLLDRWGCAPCQRPSLIGLHLLVGHHEITYYMP